MDNRSPGLGFRKSSLSAVGGCVEVAFTDGHQVVVRDSKNPQGPQLNFSVREWVAFLGGVRLGEFEMTTPPVPVA